MCTSQKLADASGPLVQDLEVGNLNKVVQMDKIEDVNPPPHPTDWEWPGNHVYIQSVLQVMYHNHRGKNSTQEASAINMVAVLW